MVLRLDPLLPVVWRSPTSLQLGVTDPPVVLQSVSVAEEHMIAALATGITPSGLELIGGTAGASIEEVAAFLAVVTPALLTRRPFTQRILVVGAGPTSQRIVQVLATLGFDVWIATSPVAAETQECDFAIAVGQFVLDPALHGLWLRRDLPHLPVILSDSIVSIGPVVDPGRTACLYCLQFHASAADPAWPAIASQLWGRTAPADTELTASQTAALVARTVIAWFSGPFPAPAPQQERLDVASGRVSTARYDPHPSCGCLAPGRANDVAIAPAQPGTGSATAVLAAPVLTSPPGPTRD